MLAADRAEVRSGPGAEIAVALAENGADPAANEQLVSRVAQGLGGLDVLVNNAGTIREGNLTELSADDVDTLLHVNIRGTVLTTRAAIPHLKGGGRIITIGSTHGDRVPFSGVTLYALTKSAHHSFTRGLARELRHAGGGRGRRRLPGWLEGGVHDRIRRHGRRWHERLKAGILPLFGSYEGFRMIAQYKPPKSENASEVIRYRCRLRYGRAGPEELKDHPSNIYLRQGACDGER